MDCAQNGYCNCIETLTCQQFGCSRQSILCRCLCPTYAFPGARIGMCLLCLTLCPFYELLMMCGKPRGKPWCMTDHDAEECKSRCYCCCCYPCFLSERVAARRRELINIKVQNRDEERRYRDVEAEEERLRLSQARPRPDTVSCGSGSHCSDSIDVLMRNEGNDFILRMPAGLSLSINRSEDSSLPQDQPSEPLLDGP